MLRALLPVLSASVVSWTALAAPPRAFTGELVAAAPSDEPVLSTAADQEVIPGSADQQVIASVSKQLIVTFTAAKRIIAFDGNFGDRFEQADRHIAIGKSDSFDISYNVGAVTILDLIRNRE